MKYAYSYIRFSSQQQARGDSLRRQTEEAAKWAEENGYTLKDLSFKDLGVSAYSGANVRGGLGQFLQAIDAGVVQAGESLLIESLDRLSRDEVLIALGIFGQILQAGVNIITWSDRKIYTAKNISDIGNIMYSIMIMCRAHEESQMKSKRSAAAWEKLRRDAIEKKTPFSKICPPWLRIEDGQYVPIPERVRLVDTIFTMSYENGMGCYSIAKELNRQNILSFTGKPWRDHAIHDLLHNAAVCGEYTPKTSRYKDGKRIMQALPTIRDYYPEVMPPEIFHMVQLELSKRRVVQESGRRGNNRNVFKHIVKCVHCGAGISYKNKTRATYLAADNWKVGKSCTCHHYWPYPDFEKRTIAALVDYQKNSGRQYHNEMISRARALVEQNVEIGKKLKDLTKNRSKLIELLDTYSLPELNKKLQDANSEIEALKATMHSNDEQIEGVSKSVRYEATIDPNLDVEDEYKRMELMQTIRSMVVYIAANMKERSAEIHLKNDFVVKV